MKVIEAITRIDTLKPNSYSQSKKIRWLSELDGMIANEIINTHEGEHVSVIYNDDSLETTMLVAAPYDDIYLKWLEAKIDYSNAEYTKYNNSSTAFNTAYGTYERYYNRTHKPIHKVLKFF